MYIHFNVGQFINYINNARMHCSRMRTARSSSRPGGGVSTYPPGTRHPSREQNSWHTLVKILPCPKLLLQVVIRLHSSRMRTAHLLPISPSMHCASGAAWSRRVFLVQGEGCLVPGGGYPSMQWGRPPPPRGQNSWHTLLKILPCPNCVAGGDKFTNGCHS